MHYNGEKLQCPKCKKQLKNPEALKEHLRAHSTVIKFECQICGSKFPRKSSFDSHNLNVHGSIRIWNAKNVSNRSMRQDWRLVSQAFTAKSKKISEKLGTCRRSLNAIFVHRGSISEFIFNIISIKDLIQHP